MKIADVRNFRAEGRNVYYNDQHGFRTDVAPKNVTFVGNRIRHNVQSGPHVEITDGIDVHDNATHGNGRGDPGDGLTRGGVFLRASRDAKVYGNTVAWNNDGITVLNSQRTNGVGGRTRSTVPCPTFASMTATTDGHAPPWPGQRSCPLSATRAAKNGAAT